MTSGQFLLAKNQLGAFGCGAGIGVFDGLGG